MSSAADPCAEALHGYHYHAFLSYSWKADYASARRLEAFFESFHRRVSREGRAVCPLSICRDGSDFSLPKTRRAAADEAPVADEVWAIIEAELERSQYLVVLCSPDAVQSSFVSREVLWFLEHRGADWILPVVTAGSDPARRPEECFPAPLLQHGVHQARIWYDLRSDAGGQRTWAFAPAPLPGVRNAEDERVRLAADLLGWDNSTGGSLLAIWEREEARRRRRQTMRMVAAAVAFVLLGTVAWTMRSSAARENRIARARDLLLDAETTLRSDPQLSLLLALEAAHLAGDEALVQLPKLEPLLSRVLLATPAQLGTVGDEVETFAWSPDGKSMAIGYQSGIVEIVAPETGARVRLLEGTEWVESVDWSADGSLLAVASRDTILVVWDAATGMPARRIRFEHSVMSVDWRANTRTLAAGQAIGFNSRVVVYDYAADRRLFDVPGMRGAWSPDGERLAAGGIDSAMYVFTADGEQVAQSPVAERVTSIRWHPDGNRFAMASVDDVVIVWQSAPLRSVARLALDFPLSVAWSPSGGLLASGTGGEEVALWSADTFEPMFQVTSAQDLAGNPIPGTGPQDYVLEVAWSPDGRILAASDRAGRVLLYPTELFAARSLDEKLRVARAQASRQLTPEECVQYLHTPDCPAAR